MGAIVIRTRYDEGPESAEVATHFDKTNYNINMDNTIAESIFRNVQGTICGEKQRVLHVIN
jgi:hypothetical protein